MARVSTEEIQVCYVCKRTSEEVPFYSDRGRFNALSSACREYKKAISRQQKRKPTEASRRANRAYYHRNKERILREQKERYWNDPEYRQRKLDNNAKWRAENRW